MTIKLQTTIITGAIDVNGTAEIITETVNGKLSVREAKAQLIANHADYKGRLFGVKVAKGEPIVFDVPDSDLFNLLTAWESNHADSIKFDEQKEG